ncbi:MAG: VWA domain-containing protein [Phycisphaeraceae bacterium]|nr:VWA domain-containing protein [Phycisphaeraceae bacterium]
MSVLYPGLALAALASVAVPILIHLLLRRRKRVIQWAAMDLLARAMRRDRRRQRLERWLLLAARCLLLALAGVAIAQPFMASSAGGPRMSRTLWLVIDDGVASAERFPDGGTALSRSRDEAQRAIAALAPGDRVGVITAAEPVRRAIDPPTADLQSVLSFLDGLTPAFTGSDLPQALREAARSTDGRDEGRMEILLLSAFRRGSLDLGTPPPVLEGALPRGARLLALQPPGQASENAWIAEIEALRRGDEALSQQERPIRLAIERSGTGLARSQRRVTAVGVGTSAVDAPLERGERRAGVDLRLRQDSMTPEEGELISIQLDPDAQPRDDERFLVLPVEQAPRVMVVDRRTFSGRGDLERLSAGAWMARAIEPGRGGRVQVDEIDPGSLDRTLLARSEVVFLARPDLLMPEGWSLLREFVDRGGALVVTPTTDDVGQRWVEAFRGSLAPSWRLDADIEMLTDPAASPWRLAPQQPPSATLRMLGSEVSLLASAVTAERRMRVEVPATEAEVVLRFEDGAPMLVAGDGPGGRGWIALLTVAPELSWSDLVVRPLMVPLMQELVRQGRSLARREEAAFVGTRVAAPPGSATLALRRGPSELSERPRVGAAAQTGSIPIAGDGRTRDAVVIPGLYEAFDSAGRRIGAVAVNVDPRRADIEPNPSAGVDSWLQASGSWMAVDDSNDEAQSAGSREPAPWSLVLLIAAAVIAVGEMVLGRILSRSVLQEVPS